MLFALQTKQQGLTVCNGEKYPDHAYPELGPKHTKVRALGDRWWCGVA